MSDLKAKWFAGQPVPMAVQTDRPTTGLLYWYGGQPLPVLNAVTASTWKPKILGPF